MKAVTYDDKQADRAYIDDPPQPALDGKPPRIKARGSQLVNGVRFFSPHLPVDGERTQLLGVGVAPTPEEAVSVVEGSYGISISQNPRLLKGPLGTILADAVDRYPLLHSANFAYTAVTPWLLPRNRRFRPNKDEIAWAAPLLHDTIRECKPDVILAFGKLAFEQLVDMKISQADARGGWFSYKDTGIPVYLLDVTSAYVLKPWTIDTLLTDMREVDRMVRLRQGVESTDVPVAYKVVDTMEQLHAMVDEIIAGRHFEISDDCEWAGAIYTDGRLRLYQLCLEPGNSYVLRFFDENDKLYLGRTVVSEHLETEVDTGNGLLAGPGEEYTDYEAVGLALGRAFEMAEPFESRVWQTYPPAAGLSDSEEARSGTPRMDTAENRRRRTYIGHQASADTPWKEHWLKLKAIGKVSFDTLYALQTCDEYAPLGLDDLSLRLTNFGRYDMPLVLWKMANRKLMKEDEGYGKVPDEILVPYSALDVEVVKRAKPRLERMLEQQKLTAYYRTIVLPFVTDTFHTFITTGLPVDRRLFDLTRGFMNWAYRALLKDFRQALCRHADLALAGASGIDIAAVRALAAARDGGKANAAVASVKEMWTGEPDELTLDHWADVPAFNIRSHPQMRRWLFGVLRLTPVKSTKNKDSGAPSMLWVKIEELPEKIREHFTPAVDKETLEILQERDDTGLVTRLLAVSNVGNQCKGFLKEGEYTEDGELVEENGLAKFIGRDGRLHANFGLTETSRPRGWKPNPLNFTKYHNRGVETGLSRILENADNDPELEIPEEFHELFGPPEERRGIPVSELIKVRMPSVRSTVAAPPGGCFVESDYQTAEVRALAFQSGDRALLRLILGKDESFGLYQGKPVRLRYEKNSPISEAFRDPRFLLAVCREGKDPQPVDEALLDRDPAGRLLHPKFDMHWAVAEECQRKPREAMDYERDRGAGKVTRFQGAYGAVGSTLDRRIEAVTGIRPEPGTGQKMLEALAVSQPDATAFLDDVALEPGRGNVLRAASGRIRHFPIHSRELRGLSKRVRDGYLRGMGNEARNFYMQESVAATLARACQGLNAFYRGQNMLARTAIGLYDAALTFCPDMEERFVAAAAHELFMNRINIWHYHNRWMSYPIDTELLYRWSWKPSESEKIELHDREWKVMLPSRAAQLEDALKRIEETFWLCHPGVEERLNRL